MSNNNQSAVPVFGLNGDTFARQVTDAEVAVRNIREQEQSLRERVGELRAEYTAFVDAAGQHERDAAELEAQMAGAMRAGQDVDGLSIRAGSATTKARAARLAAERTSAELVSAEQAHSLRQRMLDQAERGLAGTKLHAAAQAFAREVLKLRPMADELRELAAMAGAPIMPGGLLPDYSQTRIGNFTFDAAGAAR